MEMTDQNDHVILEIPNSDPTMSNYNNNLGVVKEWYRFYTGKEITNYTRQRHIQKVPLLLLEGEKGDRNRKYYEPAVVSLGPYHYKSQTRFAQAEEYKLITLAEYGLITGKPIALLHNKVFEVIHDARKCYIDGSTNDYTDEEFNRMMLRDACFVLFFIECLSCGDKKLLLNSEYLGALGFANFMRDIFLLENQIPFVVLEVLLKLRFPEDEGERILNGFFNYLRYGELLFTDEKVLGKTQRPLHLLELYRSYFISLPIDPTKRSKNVPDEDGFYNYTKRCRAFGSAMELKSRWIFLKRAYEDDIAFHSHSYYGVVELPKRAVTPNTKAIYMNMLAYELCAHSPNDFRVSTYLRIMK